MENSKVYVADFSAYDKTGLKLLGGKGANLAKLSKIEGLNVPEGFCITTATFIEITGNNAELNSLLNELARLKIENKKEIGEISAKIRTLIEAITIPQHIVDEIMQQLSRFGLECAYAVRSSATAEDLPTASFAGQQDTYLNIIGPDAVLKHISKCWASLFTERAVTYRIQNNFQHHLAYLAVIIQRMVCAQAAGVLFTAHPVNGNRKISAIDASFGLGEALVSGLVTADNYQVERSKIIQKTISAKKITIDALEDGGTIQRTIQLEKQDAQALTDEQILKLEQTGRKIEAHFGSPQDIEWCLAENTFYIVQSRPITTLYPVPEAGDQENHVYVSVGHQQMMTDAIKPLGLSVWSLTGGRPIFKTGGGRLFVDITANLATPAGRQNILDVLGHSDPLIKDALITVIERDFIKLDLDDQTDTGTVKSHKGMSSADILAEAGNNPAIVADLIKSSETALSALKRTIKTKSGTAVFDYILEDMQQRRQLAADLNSLNVIMAPIHASAWINEKMHEWLGEINAADTLSLSVPNNITSEMGMELLDVADQIRPYPAIIEYLQQVQDENFLANLEQYEGGRQVRNVIVDYLDKYGMRCAGEIDITRTRWSEAPDVLIPMILSNIKNLQPGESKRRFEQGHTAALKKEQDLLTRLKALPDGNQKAEETQQMINLVRNFIGYREYPKYHIISRYFVYKQALLKEAEKLVNTNIIQQKEDVYYLSFEEFRHTVYTNTLNYDLINKRKADYLLYKKLTPPRVITSDGEIITGHYKRGDIPAGALVGLAVSSGTVEGRARVILNMGEADLEEGDILVTAFTDPSWTPLFLAIKGLITEVGGLMTHGAVIAREYGLPAVVGIEGATSLIKDGQLIRVNGTSGYVEIIN